jgi:predicted nucleic acid-binding protein
MTDPESPRAFLGIPPPPTGIHDLHVSMGAISVFIDTSVYFQTTYRRVLAACVLAGDLVVFWSPEIRAEIARVTERLTSAAIERRDRHRPADEREPAIRLALARVQRDLDAQIAAMAPYFESISKSVSADASDVGGVADPDDRLHILAARAAGALYFLTLDDRHLPHGAVFAGVQCWHPDTFLTLFFRQNPDAYSRARRFINQLPDAVSLRLLPR